jgi:hypothetical protein
MRFGQGDIGASFRDEKMTKPAMACEVFDEAFWNDDAAPVIR